MGTQTLCCVPKYSRSYTHAVNKAHKARQLLQTSPQIQRTASNVLLWKRGDSSSAHRSPAPRALSHSPSHIACRPRRHGLRRPSRLEPYRWNNWARKDYGACRPRAWSPALSPNHDSCSWAVQAKGDRDIPCSFVIPWHLNFGVGRVQGKSQLRERGTFHESFILLFNLQPVLGMEILGASPWASWRVCHGSVHSTGLQSKPSFLSSWKRRGTRSQSPVTLQQCATETTRRQEESSERHFGIARYSGSEV